MEKDNLRAVTRARVLQPIAYLFQCKCTIGAPLFQWRCRNRKWTQSSTLRLKFVGERISMTRRVARPAAMTFRIISRIREHSGCFRKGKANGGRSRRFSKAGEHSDATIASKSILSIPQRSRCFVSRLRPVINARVL